MAGSDGDDRQGSPARRRAGNRGEVHRGRSGKGRGAAARKRLKSDASSVAEELVVQPMLLEVGRLTSFNKALQAAAR